MKLRILVVAAGCLMLPAIAGAQAKDTTARPTNIDTSGPQTAGCPKGCPTSKGAAGLSGVQFLALQQELRDRGCGNAHVTGHLDAPTRHAISVCAKQLNVANSAEAVLGAANIGFGAGDNPPTGSGMKKSDDMSNESHAMNMPKAGTRRRARAHEGKGMRTKGDSSHNESMMNHDSTMMDKSMMPKKDSTAKKDSVSNI